MISMHVMDYHLRAWKICGIWSHKGQPRWYSVYAFLLFGVVYCIFPICMLLKLMFVSSIKEVIETLMVCSTCALASVKCVIVMSMKNKLLELFTILDQLDTTGITRDDHRGIIELAIRESRSLIYLLCCCYYFGVNSAFIFCLLSSEPKLLWPAWFPFIPYENGDKVFYALLIYQYVCSMFVALIDSSVDVYGSALNKILGAHLDVLGIRLKGLGERKTDPIQLEAELNECVEYYSICIKFSKCLDKTLSFHYFAQFVCSGLIICVSAFQLSVLKPMEDFSNFLFVCEYLLSMTIQIFIPCYFGSVVTAKSQQLTKSIYSSNWLEQTPEFQSSMRIFVERSLKPIVPQSIGLIIIGLPTFVSILRAAYSLLSLLKTMEN